MVKLMHSANTTLVLPCHSTTPLSVSHVGLFDVEREVQQREDQCDDEREAQCAQQAQPALAR